MVVPGRVHNGVVVLDGDSALPEGAVVAVSYAEPPATSPSSETHRIEVPLVCTGEPGSVHLTGQRIAEVLNEEDAAP